MPEDDEKITLEMFQQMFVEERKSGYSYAMGDLYHVLDEVMTVENVILIKDIQARMEHIEGVRITTNFAPPDVRKD